MNRVSAVEAQWQKLQVTELEVLHAQYSRLRLQYAVKTSVSVRILTAPSVMYCLLSTRLSTPKRILKSG